MNPVVFDLLFSRQWFVQVLRGVCVCVCVCVCVWQGLLRSLACVCCYAAFAFRGLEFRV